MIDRRLVAIVDPDGMSEGDLLTHCYGAQAVQPARAD
jgi:hypothetical protein